MIYLASTSPRRKKILKDMGMRFKVLKPDYHESPLPGATPAKLVRAHALGKALSAARLIRQGRVLSADTVVYFRNRIIGKPRDMRDAFRILGQLQGRWHTVYTGVALLNVKAGKTVRRRIFVEKTRVRLRALDRTAMKAYFKRVDPLDKAGAYAIQASRDPLASEVRGSFLNAVGLPVERLKAERFF